ncbi:MAG TPA: peptidase MA family metallohydrolase [Candidatus Saccharimonadales bacterium]|nr:peptidase MA family metallohydrolase [Candidatus Saccharimonadales bacterium]
MSQPARSIVRALRTIGLVCVLLGLLWTFAPVGVEAAGISFGAPRATPKFGQGVTFEQPVDGGGIHVRRVEILVQEPGNSGPLVSEVPVPGDTLGATTLRFVRGEQDGHLYPNTVLSARWRIVDDTGAEQLGPSVSVTYSDTRFNWQTQSSALVRVHWSVGDASFGQRALAIAQAGIAKAEDLFGVTETEPVDFFVYANQAAFYDALGPGTRENVGGEALPEIRTLFALITPDEINASWVGVVIPHELTHLVFDTAVRNPYHFPPRWLNEGLAVYLSQGYDDSDRALVRSAAATHQIIPLDGLTGQFPTTADQFALAYAESVSAIDYFVRTFGRPALVTLIKSYAHGVTDDEAMTAAIGQSMAAFNSAWLADIGAATPTRYGPQPAPIGPLPSGWSAEPEAAASPAATIGSASGAPSSDSSAGPSTAPSGSTSAESSASAGASGPGSSSVSAAPSAAPGSTSSSRGGSTGLGSAAIALVVLGLGVVLAGLGIAVLVRERRRRSRRT